MEEKCAKCVIKYFVGEINSHRISSRLGTEVQKMRVVQSQEIIFTAFAGD
jgi:hypothetical protein